MWICKKLAKTAFKAFAVIAALATNTAKAGDIYRSGFTDAQFEAMETEIQLSDNDQLAVLEHKVARVMQERPLSVRGQYLMSTLLLRLFLSDPTNTDLIKQSADLAAQSYELNPKSELGIVALASVLSVTGDTTKGLALMNEVAKKNIELSWRYHLAMANLLTSEPNAASVLKELKMAMEDPTANRRIISPYVIAILASGLEGQTLISEIGEWQKRFPCQDFKLAMAQLESKTGHLKQALALYREVLKEDPKSGEAQLGEGFVLLKAGHDYPAAATALGKAINLKLPPSIMSEAKLSYAVALIRSGKMKEATTVATEAIALSQNNEAATLIMADEFNKQKRYDSSIAFLNALNESVPGIAMSHAIRGEILNSHMKDNAQAVHAFSDAIVLDNSRATYYNGRGLAYYGMHKLEPALADFEAAVRMDPSDASARYNTACALALLGRKNDALEALASALDLDERLTRQALADNDFKSLRSSSEFQTMTDRSRLLPIVAH